MCDVADLGFSVVAGVFKMLAVGAGLVFAAAPAAIFVDMDI